MTGSGGTASTSGTGGAAPSRTGSGGAAGATGTAGQPNTGMPGADAGTTADASGNDAPAMLATPVMRGDRCVFELGMLTMEIASGEGARITSLELTGSQLLSGMDVNATNYGSTFWTSPQTDWSWPPIAAIDNAAFSFVDAPDDQCALEGAVVDDMSHPKVSGVRIAKRWSADAAANAIDVQYSIENTGSAMTQLAPWEITRVPADGLTFYESDSAPSGDKQPPTMMATGCVWVEHSASVPIDSKLFGDAKGWIAHVNAGGVLLLKVFADVAAGQAAPGEGEVEIYTGAGYIEVEDQGSYDPIEAGATRGWSVRWYARALPSSVMASAGSSTLVDYVHGLL